MKIIPSYLTENPCYKKNKTIEVKGIMLHSVGCAQPNAQVFIRRWNRPDHDSSCVHAFIDGNTGDVYQTLPWNHRGWHAGGDANNTHIGVEMCEPSCITYITGSIFSCSNLDKAQDVATRTYRSAVQLFASLCSKYSLDPLKDGVIISHREGHSRGIASNHGDPEHLWQQLHMGYTMHGFRRDIASAMHPPVDSDAPASWAKESTDWCIMNDIFKGDETGNFHWHNPVTREELAVIIYRLHELHWG